jgi:hypothetical protein
VNLLGLSTPGTHRPHVSPKRSSVLTEASQGAISLEYSKQEVRVAGGTVEREGKRRLSVENSESEEPS